MKKRILMAVLSASMLAAMPASTVSAQVSVAVSQEAMVGQWYGNYKGVPITMSLQENGDYSVEVGVTSLGGEYNDVGTWTVRGDKIILDGSNIKDEFICTEDKIECYLNDNKVTLVKNDITAWQGYVPPAQNPDATEADFNGTWKAVYSTNSGYTLETEVTGIVSFCNIDDGIGNFFVHTSDGTNIMTTSEDLKFNAGQMSGSYIDDGEVVEEYTLSLLEDGRLFVKIVYNDGNDESDMYMEKTTAKDMEDTMEEVTNKDMPTDNDTTTETTEVSGTWQGTMNGPDGTIVTLSLNNDGEYSLSLDEVQEAGKWSKSDNVVTLESGFLKRELVFDGTTLTNEDDKIVLSKIDEK